MHDQAAGAVWFVAFPSSRAMTRTSWWVRFLRPGYRHCLACRPIGDAQTLVVNHTGRRLVVDLAPMNAGVFLRELMESAGAWVLAAQAEDEGPGGAMLRGPMTCVETVKAALGIRAPFVITPRQLARHLTRNGARPVLPAVPSIIPS